MASAARGASSWSARWQAFKNHPAGPKTVHFYAPLMKWCLVAAGLKDLNRPPEKLSVGQNVALAGTGMIWVRYSLIITPVNYSLAAVNFFVGSTGIMQLARIWKHRQEQGKAPSIEEATKEAKDELSEIVSKAESKVKDLEKQVQKKV